MRYLQDILQSMEPISLAEMSTVKLMNRVDSKFPMNMETCNSLQAECGILSLRVWPCEANVVVKN